MSTRDCLIKNGFTEDELTLMLKGQDNLSEIQFQEQMKLAIDEGNFKVKQAKIQLLAIDSAMKAINTHPSGPQNGLMSLLAFDKTGTSGIKSVETMANQYSRFAFSEMSDMMESLMPRTSNAWQVDNTMRLNIVKEIFSESTGDAEAKAFAQSFIKANDKLVALHTKMGGTIRKNDHWNLPQNHNALKIRRVDKSSWVDGLMEEGVLDVDNMINRETGESFTSGDPRLRGALESMYDAIVTNGASKMDWEAAGYKDIRVARGVQNRTRFLRFKTGESYLNYQKQFGEDNIYSSMITHVMGIAQETALMRQFGPNPGAGYNYVRSKASEKAGHKNQRLIGRADNTMKELTGELSGTNNKIQQGFETLRAINVSKLGGAAISAIGDQGTLVITSAINGLPIFKTTMIFLKHMAGGGKAEKQFLLQSMVNADYVIDIASGLARYGEVDANTVWGKFAAVPDRFIRLSGLNKMTEVGRSSIQLSALGHLANVEGLAWKDLSASNLRMLKESGINEADWKSLAKSKKQVVNGAKYIDLRELPMELQMKVGNMMDVLANRAIPAPDVEVRAIMRQGSESGTIYGEGMRSGGQFKSFGISILLYQIEFAKQFGKAGGAAYLASTFVTLTTMGMMAAQIKELVAGKETMDMTTGAAWLRAAAQGGGLGIFADFIFKDQSRFGGSMVATLAGPSAAAMETLLGRLLLAHTQQAFVAAINQDEKAFEKILQSFGSTLTDEVRKNMPSQLWYTKLVFDRYVYQTISQIADPDYIGKLHKRESRLKRDEDRGYLFQPIKL